jgi:hypothetical protein
MVTTKGISAHNRRLAQWRVAWLIEHSTSHQLLWCIDSFVLRNPPLRQAPKRYATKHEHTLRNGKRKRHIKTLSTATN